MKMAGGRISTTANFGYQNVSLELYPNQTVHTCYVTIVKHSVNSLIELAGHSRNVSEIVGHHRSLIELLGSCRSLIGTV
jgi:hypothetical protein